MIKSKQQIKVIKLFNSIVLEDEQKTLVGKSFENICSGVITNFVPNEKQKKALKETFHKINVTTLFGKKEREESTVDQLITKQLLHYIEIYGLDQPGLFNLEVSKGKILPIVYINGITQEELKKKVLALIYANAPIKDVALVKEIIEDFKIDFDINEIANNELRIHLFDWTKNVFDNGDDVVRYLCFKATGNSMLIKSKEVIDAVKVLPVIPEFIKNHEIQLANVFNRHKNIILSLKNQKLPLKNPVLKASDFGVNVDRMNTAINRVTRLSKKHHVPIKEAINKRFVSLALSNKVDASVLDKISVRDKFKYLNLLEYKKQKFAEDVFIIRNGKAHLKEDRKIYSKKEINRVIDMVVDSLKDDLAHLKGKKILVDEHVDFGLPVSRNQVLGRVPFGTKITVDSTKKISSGVYWQNEWGARDLDLSTVDKDGNRVGWGQYSGYAKDNDITFSGDVTNAPAPNGGMEFMTSKSGSYGLFVNIYSGEPGTEYELVVGTDGKDKWIKDTVFREKAKLESRGTIIGFVKDHSFVVFNTRMGGSYISYGANSKTVGLVRRGTGKFWTVTDVLNAVGVKYHTERKAKTNYYMDLSYDSFSYDFLEELFYKNVENAVDKAAA